MGFQVEKGTLIADPAPAVVEISEIRQAESWKNDGRWLRMHGKYPRVGKSEMSILEILGDSTL